MTKAIVGAMVLWALCVPAEASDFQSKCEAACVKKCLAEYTAYVKRRAKRSKTTVSHPSLCGKRCSHSCTQQAHHQCRLCTVHYIRHLQRCQGLSVKLRAGCQGLALKQKQSCQTQCPVRQSKPRPVNCMRRCIARWKRKIRRCKRLAHKGLKVRCKTLCQRKIRHCQNHCRAQK